ncbi:hypothetical protein AB0M57_15105 [Streptomyces sp. NPDC051597]|uniref:hypothetical protein n=1 Tax=Streptomyces sp. NPDC051597 TaxID=3155049 RepID=UPI0034232DF1
MAPARHHLDRAWEFATRGNAPPEWEPEPDLLHVLTPGPCTRWACGTRQRVLWRVHPDGGDRRAVGLKLVTLKLVTADQWRGTVAQLATDLDPHHGGATVTVPRLTLGTYWVQLSCGSRLLASSKPFTIGPTDDARPPSYGQPGIRPAPHPVSGYSRRYGP